METIGKLVGYPWGLFLGTIMKLRGGEDIDSKAVALVQFGIRGQTPCQQLRTVLEMTAR